MFEITFKNESSENNIEEKALEYMQSRINDFTWYMDNGLNEENENPDIPPFFEYGLSFDGTEDEDTGEIEYYCYLLSWDGPPDEIRFYPDRIEYVYMDWFCGIGFDVTNESWAEWLRDFFIDCEMIKF